jgi:hypothetical protein
VPGAQLIQERRQARLRIADQGHPTHDPAGSGVLGNGVGFDLDDFTALKALGRLGNAHNHAHKS